MNPAAIYRRLCTYAKRLGAAVVLSSFTFTSTLVAGQSVITDDFDFGFYSPFVSNWQKSVPVCVWDSTGDMALFRVIVEGQHANHRFRLSNSSGGYINYNLYWLLSDQSRRERLLPGRQSNRTYSTNDVARCQNGPSGYLRVTLASRSVERAPTGTFSDTLELTIVPL